MKNCEGEFTEEELEELCRAAIENDGRTEREEKTNNENKRAKTVKKDALRYIKNEDITEEMVRAAIENDGKEKSNENEKKNLFMREEKI